MLENGKLRLPRPVIGLAVLAAVSASYLPAANATEQQLTKLMREVMSSWDALDANAAAPYYAKDPGLVFYDISPMKFTGWTEYYKGVGKEYADYKSYQIVLANDAQAHLVGDSFAWGTATWKGHAVKKDNSVETSEGRWTVLFEKRNGKWLVVHEHISSVTPPTPLAGAKSK